MFFGFATLFTSCQETSSTLQYTVAFDTDGGSAIASIKLEKGAKLTKPTNPTKPNYIFINWYKDEAKTTLFDFAAETVTANTIVYAKWERQQYAVTFYTDGGNDVASVEVAYGDKLTKPENPTKADYIFLNWYKDEAKTVLFNFDIETITKPITLYAKWDFGIDIEITTSFVGIQSLELTINSNKNITISAIVHLANKPEPIWTNVKDKVGLLTRNIVANTPKRIFTAKHYDTNDNLKTNIEAMSAVDLLQLETSYKVYVFSNKSLIKTLSFTTQAIPPASDFLITNIGGSPAFSPSVLPDTGTSNTPYEVYTKEEEVLLLPLYMKKQLKAGWRCTNAKGTIVINCVLNSCIANSGYALIQERIYENIETNTYQKVILGFQSFNRRGSDAGVFFITENVDQPYVIRLISDE